MCVKELPEQEVAYFRHIGNYLEAYKAWERLLAWAIPLQLVPPKVSPIGMSLDDPAVVEADACRYDACITLPVGFAKELRSDVQFKTLPGGLYAVFPFYGGVEEFGGHYQNVFSKLLPASEFVADGQRHCLEYSMNNPMEDPERKSKVDLYVPVQSRG